MLEIIDEFCWEKHNKILTCDMHGIQGLKNVAYWNMPTALRPAPLHHHPDILELHCMVKGRRTSHVHGRTYSLTGNEMLITFPYEPHYTSANDLSPCSFYGFQIDVSSREHLLGLNREYSLALFEILTTLEYRHLRYTSSDEKLLSLAFENISDGEPATVMLGVQYLSCFLFKIPEFIPIRKEKNITDENIKRVLDHIDRQYREALHLKELAAISGYSLSRFKGKFKEVVGITPANYITFKKLEYAKLQLAGTDLPITQIALDAGFSSSNYFCTVFHNYTQFTPTDFRRTYLERKAIHDAKGSD